jgi:ATP-dependent Clp protease protease subunit
MDHKNEFGKFARSEYGISSLKLHHYEKQTQASMTPYVVEERDVRIAQIDVFSMMMRERIIWVAGEVDDNMSTVVQAQLMYLDSTDDRDITMHIDTPGGSVKSGLSMIDVMEYINSDIRTVNTGMAASMGSVLLGAGTKGKRSSLRFSKVMLHQSSGGFRGNIQDAKIDFVQWEEYNVILFQLLGEYSGKKPEQVMKDATRDFWLNAEDAVKYGIIDQVIYKKGQSKSKKK